PSTPDPRQKPDAASDHYSDRGGEPLPPKRWLPPDHSPTRTPSRETKRDRRLQRRPTTLSGIVGGRPSLRPLGRLTARPPLFAARSADAQSVACRFLDAVEIVDRPAGIPAQDVDQMAELGRGRRPAKSVRGSEVCDDLTGAQVGCELDECDVTRGLLVRDRV